MRVGVRQVSKRFGVTAVLKGVSFEVEEHELFFLLGPSGCGKTTLLRLVAGFNQPDAGEIWFGDRPMNGVEPHRRNTGMVFQNYALWPHLTVSENVGYGLKVRAVPTQDRRQRVAEALRAMRMESYAERRPNQLSGGQQQRVALARALVVRPDVLLLDEPLSNLDARLRLDMRDEIRRIHDETRLTTLYVTHDQKEALSMADRIAVMRDGVIEQIGPPREIYRQPANRFVAEFIGETNWLPGIVRASGAQGQEIETPVGRLVAKTGTLSFANGARVEIGIRPESVRLSAGPVNQLTATIEEVTYLGEAEQYILKLSDGGRLKVIEQNPESLHAVASTVTFHVPPSRLFVLTAP